MSSEDTVFSPSDGDIVYLRVELLFEMSFPSWKF